MKKREGEKERKNSSPYVCMHTCARESVSERGKKRGEIIPPASLVM